MIFGHKWLHDKVYFLHKKHHKASNKCLVAFGTSTFDLLDMVIEFGGGVPSLIIAQKLLFNPTSKVHFLTYGLVMLRGFKATQATLMLQLSLSLSLTSLQDQLFLTICTML